MRVESEKPSPHARPQQPHHATLEHMQARDRPGPGRAHQQGFMTSASCQPDNFLDSGWEAHTQPLSGAATHLGTLEVLDVGGVLRQLQQAQQGEDRGRSAWPDPAVVAESILGRLWVTALAEPWAAR